MAPGLRYSQFDDICLKIGVVGGEGRRFLGRWKALQELEHCHDLIFFKHQFLKESNFKAQQFRTKKMIKVFKVELIF